MQRNTRFSSNDYFLKLSQLQAGEEDKAPKLDKKICGGSLGGPVSKDKLFFFGNYERLNEDSETPVLRNVPSMSMRDGVLIYQCADAGGCPGDGVSGLQRARTRCRPAYHGMTPAELAAVDPLHIGPSKRPCRTTSSSIPTPNDPGVDGYNIVGYRFAAPIKNAFNTYIGRADYRDRQPELLRRVSISRTTRSMTAPQYPGQRAAQHHARRTSRGFAFGWDSVLVVEQWSTRSATASRRSTRTSSACRRKTCRWTSATSTRSTP